MDHTETSNNSVPLWERITLSLDEAVLLTGIGKNTLGNLAKQEPDLGVRIGSRQRFKRKYLEEYLLTRNNL